MLHSHTRPANSHQPSEDCATHSTFACIAVQRPPGISPSLRFARWKVWLLNDGNTILIELRGVVNMPKDVHPDDKHHLRTGFGAIRFVETSEGRGVLNPPSARCHPGLVMQVYGEYVDRILRASMNMRWMFNVIAFARRRKTGQL